MSGRDQFGQYLPGQSGNPKGRPKKNVTLRQVLRNKVDRDKLVQALLQRAYAGDDKAIRMVLQYHDGLPAQMAPDEGQVSPASVILLPSNGREFSDQGGEEEEEDEED